MSIALAKVRIIGNTSENLLTEISQLISSLCWAKEITKKVYNNIMIQQSCKTEWILYLWILKTVKHPTFIDYYSISQIKQT